MNLPLFKLFMFDKTYSDRVPTAYASLFRHFASFYLAKFLSDKSQLNSSFVVTLLEHWYQSTYHLVVTQIK